MNTPQTYHADFATHPGVILSENLEFFHMSQKALSERTGLTEKHICRIIKGKASITPGTALKLEKVLGIKATFWNTLEKNYQETLARTAREAVMDTEIKTLLPHFRETYTELIKHKCIEHRLRWTKNNFQAIQSTLLSFFGTTSLAYVQNSIYESAFRKYKDHTINAYTLAAWLRLGELKAQQVSTMPFDRKKLENNLNAIKSLSLLPFQKSIHQLETLLASCGIVLVCAPLFKNTSTQGATKWISKDKACIILKTTNQGEDKFWFNLFHELGHILKHGKAKTFIDLEDHPDSPEEQEANLFAQKHLTPNFNKTEVLQCGIKQTAKRYNISPSIVAGRLSHEEKTTNKEIYKIVSSHIRRIDFRNV